MTDRIEGGLGHGPIVCRAVDSGAKLLNRYSTVVNQLPPRAIGRDDDRAVPRQAGTARTTNIGLPVRSAVH